MTRELAVVARAKKKGSSSERAVAYVRVSTEEQSREGVSLDAQEARLRAYCLLHSLELTAIYRDEGISAGRPLGERPQGASMLLALAGGTVHHVIAMKLDRLFRDVVDCMQRASEWERQGVALHLVDLGGQTVNTNSASGRFMLTILAGAGEMEKNLVRERTAQALRFKRERGDRLGTTPLGYRTPVPGAAMEQVPEELAVVRLLLSLRDDGLTYRGVAEELARRGARTKRGGLWRASTVRAVCLRRERYDPVFARPDDGGATDPIS